MNVVLITGDDNVLITEAVQIEVRKFLGDDERSLALQELDEDDYRIDGNFEISPLIAAIQTAPFLSNRRVVVARHFGRFFQSSTLAPLLEYLDNPIETTVLILVWEKGITPVQQRLQSVPKFLIEALNSCGGLIKDSSVGRGKQADLWLESRFNEADLELDSSARKIIVERLGNDRSRIVNLLPILLNTFGEGAKLSSNDIFPYLGKPGELPPWELTDNIESGNVSATLLCLHRMLETGDRHPFSVIATLHSYYERLLRLDGSNIKSENEAAKALNIASYPAKKALSLSRRLGTEKIFRCLTLLAEADLDLRGRTALPQKLVVEVLVARLATITRR